jgi:glucose/arabinose dehydrogenase
MPRGVRRLATVVPVGLCILVLAGGAAAAPQPPAGFIDTKVAEGIGNPTAMAWDPTARIFVADQNGDLRVIKNGKLLPRPFVHLNVDSNGERGLLGVAIDPSFNSNHYVYLYYTVPGSPAHNRVSRFTASGDVAVPGSEVVLLDLNALSGATNHNGGAIHFGVDGRQLYIATGDNANGANSQTLSNLLGKILRMNPDGSIPTDNPFYNTANGKNRLVWALGLRNPFTFTFHPSSARMFINDVGESTWEEINDGIAGSNYGWPNVEGPANPPNPAFRDPIFAYGHGSSDTLGCAIVGGAFYNPPIAYFPSQFIGRYFFADLCSDWIRQLAPANGNAVNNFARQIPTPVDLTVGRDGSLYYLSRGFGGVHRISYQRPPTLSGFTPGSGIAGKTEVRLNGTYLAGATSVKFNGKPATFTVVLDTQLLAKPPAGATSGPISVTTAAGTATTATSFNVTLSITGFSPASGPVGTPVVISGIGFSSATSVQFNGTAASFTIQSPNSIRAIVPSGATTGPITVGTAAGKTQSKNNFAVT